jgi:uncharacterized protein YutE (UPF0331/DUF86 family)
MSPGQIDRSVLADRIAIVRRMLDGARALPLSDFDAFTSDARTPAAAESFLRRALEALLDLGRHVLAKGFGRAPAEYAEVARQLGELGVVHQSLVERFVLMARYRNRMVHFYDEVTTREIYDLLTTRLADFEVIVAAILTWVDEHPDRVGGQPA